MKTEYKHSSPINILENTTRFLVLLVFPVLRALFFSHFDFKVWIKGAWFDIITICLILLMGFIEWFKYVYCLTEDGINIRKGIFIIRKRFIPYKNLSMVSIIKPYYLIPFSAARVTADTNGGFSNISDFEITVNKRELEQFRQSVKCNFSNGNEIKRIYKPQSLHIAVLSLVVSNSIAGVLLMSTFISGLGNVLGTEVRQLLMGTLTDLATKLIVGIPPTAAIIAMFILVGWVVSFLITMISHLRFIVQRQGGNIEIHSGVFTLREYFITVKRINLIEIKQSFLTKLFSLSAVFIHCTGYGKAKDELSVLIPAGIKKQVDSTLKLLLPEIPMCKPTIKPKLKYLSRFLIPPLSWIGAVTGVYILTNYFFPQLNKIPVFIYIMLLIPCIWFLCVKITSFLHTGVGYEKDTYTFRYTYIFSIKTVVVPKERIMKLTVRRSLFQVMSGCCDLVILTYSEGMKRHVVPNLKYEEALKIMELKHQ